MPARRVLQGWTGTGADSTWPSEVTLDGSEPVRFGPFGRNVFTSPVQYPLVSAHRGVVKRASSLPSWPSVGTTKRSQIGGCFTSFSSDVTRWRSRGVVAFRALPESADSTGDAWVKW